EPPPPPPEPLVPPLPPAPPLPVLPAVHTTVTLSTSRLRSSPLMMASLSNATASVCGPFAAVKVNEKVCHAVDETFVCPTCCPLTVTTMCGQTPPADCPEASTSIRFEPAKKSWVVEMFPLDQMFQPFEMAPPVEWVMVSASYVVDTQAVAEPCVWSTVASSRTPQAGSAAARSKITDDADLRDEREAWLMGGDSSWWPSPRAHE